MIVTIHQADYDKVLIIHEYIIDRLIGCNKTKPQVRCDEHIT